VVFRKPSTWKRFLIKSQADRRMACSAALRADPPILALLLAAVL
jgi:hypothetical protein